MITADRAVHADPDRLWGLISQVTRWAELLPTVQRVRGRVAGQAPAVGARYAIKQPGIPVLVYEISEWKPGEGFTWIASSPGVRTVGTHAAIPAPDGSTLRLSLRWEGPLAVVVERLFGRRTNTYVQREADTFARLAEQAGQP